MIVTILLLLKKFLELAKKYNSTNFDFNVDFIDPSTYLDSLNESSVVFMNCEEIQLGEATSRSGFECFQWEPHNCCLKRRKGLGSKRPLLNTLKKMEFEEDGHKDLLNGITAGFKGNLISPASDCNSNNLTMPKENMFLCSTDSMHDCPDFLQDNSEYQWFLDYGYKYNNSHHQSILSLSRSQDLIYYDDMARNIDANLAEVDMDDFNREDIHSVLSSLPNIQGVEEREMFASVTGSMMVKFDFDTCVSPRSNSQEEQINASICKSQILFSPVHENYLPNSSLSVDSLELSENDINLMVTCQSNKNNYTIAFEGSTVMTSDDSESRETCTSGYSRSEGSKLHSHDMSDSERNRSNSRNAMMISDSTFTTWSKIKENPCENLHLRRHPSGNNNTTTDIYHSSRDVSSVSFKSLSLPNLFRSKQKQNSDMSLSVKCDSELKKKSSDCRLVKLYDIQSNSKNMNQSTSSASKNPAHNFSLVKLFIKQKSASHEGMSNYTVEEIVNNDTCKNSPNCQNIEKISANSRITEIADTCSLKNFENTSLTKIVKNEEIINTKAIGLNQAKPNVATSQNENFVRKQIISKSGDKKPDHNGYYSDESTQENGSNTESAENLTCNCTNKPVIGKKTLLTEKSIQTSEVLENNENTQKKPLKVPVYILYPNYSLPNLEFLKREHYVQNIDFSKIFLKPQKFCAPESPTTPKSLSKPRGRRPFSVSDIETLKKTGFKHVKDWESLTFLLPKEYKQFLQEIPEIVSQLKDFKHSKEEVVPLFCLSPPPSRKVRKRPNSCDVNFSNDSRSSNFSSTATQPSSGYRGSSTMLNSNNSYNTNSPRNPSFSYKYEVNSESVSSRKNGFLSNTKNHHVNSNNSNESLPQRPPLPKGILRNNSLDNYQYTCKTQKEYANKRYSMVELTDKNLVLEEKCSKKRTLHPSSSKSPQAFTDRVHEEKPSLDDVQSGSNKPFRNVECQENPIKSNLENDMRRLEELLEISSVFGESVESFTETDMMRLRSQVSKFLTMQKNLEKVSETLQTVDEGKIKEFDCNKSTNACEDSHSLTVKNLLTPHNTPEHKKQPCNSRNLNINAHVVDGYSKPCNCNGQTHEIEDYFKFMDENLGGLKKTVSFAEKISFAVKEHELVKEKVSSNAVVTGQKNNQIKAKRPVDLPICEESTEGPFLDSPTSNVLQNSVDLLQKRELILDVENAVKKILKLCKETKEDPANLCLHYLCPSLYAVLSDGLKEEIDTPFGPIRNSVWSVIEASSQQGPMTQTLNELVQRLNRDEIFTEGLIKFNAFIFGLLNARALSGWFSYLRTRDSLLRKYYDNTGLLWLSNTARAPYRVLVTQLMNIIEPLCSLQFNLELMYQTKLLHCSLQNLNCLLEEPSNSDFLTPTKQFMLLKLVHSIQSSLSQSGEGKKSKHVLENMEKKTSDPPVGQLLMENKNMRTRRNGSKTRPRSGITSAATNQEAADVASAMKKRWSGVNLNSKLVEAFDRLVDESESDYTDSLDVPAPRPERVVTAHGRNVQKGNPSSISRDLEADIDTKNQKKNILLNLNKKSNAKIEDCLTELKEKEIIHDSASEMQNGGQKFKRLQQKWERWEKSGRSSSDSDSDIQLPSSERKPSQKGKSLIFNKSHKSEKSSCDSNNTMPSPTSRISKIPRLVTSPLSSTPSIKSTGNQQRLASPTSSNSNQKVRKATANPPKENSNDGKVTTVGGNRVSRVDEKTEPVARADSGKHQTPFTTNSHRRYNSAPAKKSESVSGRAPTMSLNRKPVAKKLHQAPRTVRTLTHRLPSDSGHLSFNAGEKLKVVLEVDKVWLLCCRGSQKGLVPKSLVISDIDDKF